MIENKEIDIGKCRFAFWQENEQPDGKKEKVFMCKAAFLANPTRGGVFVEFPLAENQVCVMFPQGERINDETCDIALSAINKG